MCNAKALVRFQSGRISVFDIKGATMKQREIADNLIHKLELYAISQDDSDLAGILNYAGMLAGSIK